MGIFDSENEKHTNDPQTKMGMDLLKDTIFGKTKQRGLIRVAKKKSYLKYSLNFDKNVVMIHYDPSYSGLKPLLDVYTKITEKF
jgi:hypothetical protein